MQRVGKNPELIQARRYAVSSGDGNLHCSSGTHKAHAQQAAKQKGRTNIMRYFAYGSNLSSQYMRRSCPSATFIMKADLPNYGVEFRHFSEKRQGGISSIVEAPGKLVRGVIYETRAEEIEALDIVESVPQGLYRRDTFLVMGEDGNWHEAELYRVVQPRGPYPPAKEYLDQMIEGAREHELEAGYIEELVSLRRSLD
jgi:gamma-glutamylcyclotransferase (GGCT)/AIG2-like uncharacterized protein YtfP